MIPTFAQIARSRRPVLATLAPGIPPSILLPLWPEAEKKPGVPHDHPNTWRCLTRATVAGPWKTIALHEGGAIVIEQDEEPLRTVDLALLPAYFSGVAQPDWMLHALCEAVALAGRTGIRISFAYWKVGRPRVGSPEIRSGMPVGANEKLLFLLDDGREKELRTFRLDAMEQVTVLPEQALPRWDSKAESYAVPDFSAKVDEALARPVAARGQA